MQPQVEAARAVAILALNERGDLLAAYARRAGCGSADTEQPGLKDWLPQADGRERELWLALRDSLLQDVAGSFWHHTTHTDSLLAQIEQSGCAISSLPDSACDFLAVWASGDTILSLTKDIGPQLVSRHKTVGRPLDRNAKLGGNRPFAMLQLPNKLWRNTYSRC